MAFRVLLSLGAISSLCLSVTPAIAQDDTQVSVVHLLAELRELKSTQAETTQKIEAIEQALITLQNGDIASEVDAPPRIEEKRAVEGKALVHDATPRLAVSGDLRLRYEANSGAADIRDRHRNAIRGRLRAKYALFDAIGIGAQLSTGDPGDPNSADVTLGDFADDFQVSLDQYYVSANFGSLSLSAGKFPQPFNHTDMVWDGDVSPAGFVASYAVKTGGISFKLTGLYSPIDESAGGPDSSMLGGQLRLSTVQKALEFGAAVGFYDYRLRSLDGADAGDFRTNLLDPGGRYLSDFDLLDTIVWIKYSGLGEEWPVSLTGNYVKNLGAAVSADSGASFELLVGRSSVMGDWRFGYGYSESEVDAVLAAFSNDNLPIGTNYKLHAFTLDHAINTGFLFSLWWYHYRQLDSTYPVLSSPLDWQDRIRAGLTFSF